MNIYGYGAPETCVCGKVIPAKATYYAIQLSDDADAGMAFINEWHDECLREWDFERDNTEIGVVHLHYEVAA